MQVNYWAAFNKSIHPFNFYLLENSMYKIIHFVQKFINSINVKSFIIINKLILII